MDPFFMSSHYLRLIAAFLVVLGTGFASAQAPDSPDHFFSQQVGVEVVSIDVVVIGADREPVHGLSRKDFELRIDGKRVEIANFYATQSGPKEPAPAPAPPADETHGAPVAPEDAGAPEANVRAVVFLDNFYLAPNGRKRLLEDMPAFLERVVADGTEVMVAAHDRSTEILSPFTTELDELTDALARAGRLPASGHAQRRQRMSTLRSIADLFDSCPNPCVNCWEQMIAFASSYRSWVENDRFGTLDALGDLVNALNLYEGRKVLYYVSDGMQLQGGADVFHYLGEVCPTNYRERRVVEARLRLEGLTDFHRLTAAANASRVTIYSIEAAGLRGFSAASVEMNRNPSPVNDSIRIGNLQNTLTLFAHETGGRAVLNANHFDSELRSLSGELGSFYSLGYSPSHPGAGTHPQGQRESTRRQVRRAFSPHVSAQGRRSAVGGQNPGSFFPRQYRQSVGGTSRRGGSAVRRGGSFRRTGLGQCAVGEADPLAR